MTSDRVHFSAPQEISSGWKCAILQADLCRTPDEAIKSGDWISAKAPGTTAQALSEAGLWPPDDPSPLHDQDVWYVCDIVTQVPSRLRLEGLATIAEVWINGQLATESISMFLPVDIELKDSGSIQIAICFRSLKRYLDQVKGKRARWRTALADNQSLRFVRTTLLGHMPGWCPQIDCVGPYRTIKLFPGGALSRESFDLWTHYSQDKGFLSASFTFPEDVALPGFVTLLCAGRSVALVMDGRKAHGLLELDNVEPWWPHTHGKSMLYEVAVDIEGNIQPLGAAGFRSVEIDHGADESRFGFVVNGVKIFARGVCWTPWELASLPGDKSTYYQALRLMRDAGFNMVRIPGMTLYESPEFFEVADELGIMVWQDLQFANFDYPFSDKAFHAAAVKEIENFLSNTRRHCSLVALCGGSEVEQQAAMMGLPSTVRKVEFLEGEAKAILLRDRPDIVYVENSPWGGDLPFSVNHGVGHYYGVGAYLRPLEDARRADVSFAAECLAFSNVPDPATLRAQFSPPVLESLGWKEGVPRDRGACWDFEDVREFYMNLLYGVDCAVLKDIDPARYLALARACIAEVMETAFHEWRRPKSRTDGALVFLWKDLRAGAGWGIVDLSGRPKSAWYALRRACQPVQLLLTDEGVNGLHLHVVNETQSAQNLFITMECMTESGDIVASGEAGLSLGTRQSRTLTGAELLGAFFDVNYAYKFGARAHDIVVARLNDRPTSENISEVYFFPGGRGSVQYDNGLKVELLEQNDSFSLNISCRRFAQTVAIDDEYFRPADNYFHLAPGRVRCIRLERIGENRCRPSGIVSSLNGLDVARY